MGKNLVPPLKVRLQKHQYEWLMQQVTLKNTNVNAFLKALVNAEMVNNKGKNND